MHFNEEWYRFAPTEKLLCIIIKNYSIILRKTILILLLIHIKIQISIKLVACSCARSLRLGFMNILMYFQKFDRLAAASCSLRRKLKNAKNRYLMETDDYSLIMALPRLSNKLILSWDTFYSINNVSGQHFASVLWSLMHFSKFISIF